MLYESRHLMFWNTIHKIIEVMKGTVVVRIVDGKVIASP